MGLGDTVPGALRVLPEEVIPVAFVPTDWRVAIKRHRRFEENRYFVDRETHRDEFWKAVDVHLRTPAAAASTNVVFVAESPISASPGSSASALRPPLSRADCSSTST